ncbi:MAG: DUF1957 domain-containing protein [Candidatus Wallbacteria bacterium]|nr:DUF1957 domain-containing protein [Candidatus Wallbacteria bacterium]
MRAQEDRTSPGKSTERGYFALVLHAHLPFVRHPEHEDFLEERWLYEAITETYIPLLTVFERLIEEKIPVAVSMSLTPTLTAMLSDPLLQARYVRHIDRLIELAEREVQRTRWLPEFHPTALHYLESFRHCRTVFVDRYKRDLLRAFREVAAASRLELMTCAATHGFLPLLSINPAAVRAQIKVATASHRRLLGASPSGIWLPECGYAPGVERELAAEKIRFFLVDSHGLLNGRPRPRHGVFAPALTPAGVAVFGRDLESSRSVWSADVGYPGDPEYRDFYRDIGFDLEHDYIHPYVHESGLRVATGIKYHRITGRTDDKQPYRPEAARLRAEEHAADFVARRQHQVRQLERFIGRKPIVVSPYDAELFGHWWYEGPMFIDFVLRKLHLEQSEIAPITPLEYLETQSDLETVELSFSSWGHRGFGEVWLNESNDWIYRHLHRSADRMVAAAAAHGAATGVVQRALNQMARELLLAQASDWAFIMAGKTAVEYAVRRTHEHLARFNRLRDEVESGLPVDETWLAEIESKDNIFPDIDFRVYGSSE